MNHGKRLLCWVAQDNKNKTTILTLLSLADTTTPAKCKLKTIEKTLKRLRILTKNIEEYKIIIQVKEGSLIFYKKIKIPKYKSYLAFFLYIFVCFLFDFPLK